MMPAGSPAFQGNRATYVALAAVSILTLSLVCSTWHSDMSGSIALLGLLSIYMSSTELLVLFTFIAPASILIDMARLSGDSVHNGYGWLLFFLVLEMLAKVVGAGFSYSLYRSISSGEGASPAGGVYTPIVPSQVPYGGAYPAAGGGAMPAPNASSMMAAQAEPEDPFASYAPPRAPGAPGQPPAYNNAFPGA
uniref:Uncharacterized protein n=1 Tax=Dunaliella tertiolecta TaxID=3047 RepID=A0A7S3QMI6_DUNTE|mmetsp:Transcript_20148/g.56109  ORF Transcript_20148/g.56109 Transcript_20148/m.56109 type:complete len:193 (-) Transcript_20148:791-1369(-)|eukprot:CAMPEP_0202352528 /NCGR_PEP_ID=MMETSP1126-20121109/8683_1 /ASSEMBLY_ACC=CAM_ASM_000457 /TAXON_ID=3047 /ORGANISM="Dunaliella tertiolecta, Strain CCMP1320" /LENGTH=192 /DNA_ID=CAMNT_0048944755 /DNA_START=128 /DNA_END=706 /DNA_ORIENTATION=+